MSLVWALTTLLGIHPGITWQPLAEGLDYASITWVAPTIGDGRLHVVRIDPRRAELVAVLATNRDRTPRTAGDWVKAEGLAAAINLGMYDQDHLSNVGHLHQGKHQNRSGWHSGHQSVLGLGPGAAMFDLDRPGVRAELTRYDTVIQNLRILKGEGESVWKPNNKRRSEAAVGVDREGRVYFAFCRTPLMMSDFAQRIAATLSLERAMHVEGGPEASLSIHAGGVDVDLAGSYETGFNENDDNHGQWSIPNVLGARARR